VLDGALGGGRDGRDDTQSADERQRAEHAR